MQKIDLIKQEISKLPRYNGHSCLRCDPKTQIQSIFKIIKDQLTASEFLYFEKELRRHPHLKKVVEIQGFLKLRFILKPEKLKRCEPVSDLFPVLETALLHCHRPH